MIVPDEAGVSLRRPPNAPEVRGRLVELTRFVLRHRRMVAAWWLLLTIVGMASAGSAWKALSDEFSVPGREGYETNAAITRTFGSGDNSAPLVPVVTLPPGTSINSPAVMSGLAEVVNRIEEAVPGVRVASYRSSGDRAFVSRDGRTIFMVAYPPLEPGNFGPEPGSGEVSALGAARG